MPVLAWAQPHYSQVLKDVEAKNPALQAAAKQREAQKASVRSGSLLPNPEIEAAYLLGSPTKMGNRWDLGVSQSFEMPSVLARRAKLFDLQENAADLDYEVVRNATLLEVQQLCADLIYYRNIVAIYSRRYQSAKSLAESYEKRFHAGDCSILEYNCAQLNMADAQNRLAVAEMELDRAMHDLRLVMNDDNYEFQETAYSELVVEPSFEQWFEKIEANNPTLRLLNNEVTIAEQENRISRAQWMPEMSVGYASENEVGEAFRGVKVGLTIPIWSQQRAVKASRLHAEASQEALKARRTELFAQLRCMYHRQNSLIQSLGNLRKSYEQLNSTVLLEKALAAGELSIEQYLQQLDYYYEIEMRVWEVSHEVEQLHLQLHAVEL